jgi:hypothetical protein
VSVETGRLSPKIPSIISHALWWLYRIMQDSGGAVDGISVDHGRELLVFMEEVRELQGLHAGAGAVDV